MPDRTRLRGRVDAGDPGQGGRVPRPAAASLPVAGRTARRRRRERLAAEPDGPARVGKRIALLWTTFHEPHFWAAIELWTAARTNPALAAALRDAIRGVANRLGPQVCAHPHYPELRDILFTSMRGAAMPYTFEDRDPATDPHVAIWTAIASRTRYGNDVAQRRDPEEP